MARRGGRLSRKINTRNPKPKIYVVCEGEKTEPLYFQELCRQLPRLLYDVKILKSEGDPRRIAERALGIKKEIGRDARRGGSFAGDDQVWAVFDHDNHAHFAAAIKLCEQGKVGLAISDPCFELWLILHIEDYDKADDQRHVQRHLQRIFPSYDRSGAKTGNFDELLGAVDRAEERAKAQLQRRIDDGNPNSRPYTKVQNLTQALRKSASA